MPTVKVTFPSSAQFYSYAAPKGDWKIGDLAVVESPSSGFTLTTIQEIEEATYPGNKHVVGIVSLDNYNDRKAKAARKQAIIKQLERAEKALKEADRFAHLRSDPALANLLTELDDL